MFRIRLFLLSVFVLLSVFMTPGAVVYAQEWDDFSADVDGDGLPNSVEQQGWYYDETGGPYTTDYLDADTDDDGLSDGREKLYGTDPNSDRSPGIYVEYDSHLQTREYYVWWYYGNHYAALPLSFGSGAVVVRRGTTFSVGGPLGAELDIEKSKSGLDSPTVERDPCTGRWNVTFPSGGTVGIYTLKMEKDDWDEVLNLYVIFDLPTNMSEDFVSAYIYTESPLNRNSRGQSRSEVSLVYAEGNDDPNDPPPREYTKVNYSWIPEGEWVNHGYGWTFDNQQFRAWLLTDYVMPYINGHDNTWDAANALRDYIDDVTCLDWPRVLYNSWQVLHPMDYYPYNGLNQCSNMGAMLTAVSRSAGIPSRPVWTDWEHGTFDHATEVWTSKPSYPLNWYVMRGGSGEHGDCWETPHYDAGDLSRERLRKTKYFYHGQGVYAVGEDWPWTEVDRFTVRMDAYRQNSWDPTVIVKRDWWETRFKAYWGTSSEPTVIGTPPNDWPDDIPPAPVADFTGDPLIDVAPVQVSFTDQSQYHVRTWDWDFGDGGGSGADDPNHTYDEPGLYTVILEVQGAGGSDTETKTSYIKVYEAVNAAFQADPMSGSAPLQVNFTNQSTGDVDTCAWDFGDDDTSTSCSPGSHTYTDPGVYTVMLTVQGKGGDEDSVSDLITATGSMVMGFNGASTSGGADDFRRLVSFAGQGEASLSQVSQASGIQASTLPQGGNSASSIVYLPAILNGTSLASSDEPGSGVQFGSVLADYGVDLDGDGRFDSLVFEVEVNVARAGDYWIRGALAGNFAETVIDARLETGRQVIALPFDGRKVYMNKADGPYVLEGLWSTDVEDPSRADLTDNALTYAEPAYQTSPYRFGDFGVAGATLSDAYDHRVVDTDGDGYADALVLETNLNIEKAGTYTVRGVLHDAQDNMLAEATWIGSDTQVSLQFADLRETVGPYTVYLHVRNAADQVVDGVKEPLTIEAVPALSAKPIHLGGRTITPVDPTASRRPDFVITSTGYSDVGVDTDGDGRFDQLVITVGVEVEAGEGGKAYHLEGWLADANDSLISWAIGDAEVLAEGIQSLTLAFDGRMINEHGVDGPFTLVALKAAQTYTETLDEAAVAYTTSSYDSDEFEEAVAAPAMNFFADDMENWLFTGDSFESGTLNAGWTISSSTFATTAEQGRIQVTGDYGTAEGMYALLMDDFVDDDKFTLNEAIWTVDLSDVEEATLSFWHAEWDDEAHAFNGEFTGSYKADGVAISDDGTNWYPILDAPNQADGVWYFYTFDLVAEATAAGMTLGPDFKIKFQQYDNYPLPIEGSLSDGRGWDEIVIAGKGSLGDQWTSESPWDLEENMGYSYAHAWGADVSGAANGLLTATSSTDLAAYVDTTLKFATCYEMPTGSDAGYVEVSSNGLDWTKVLTLANSTSPWATQLLGLEDFDGASNLQFRFNAASQTGLSWYVDDVYLNAWPAVTGATFGYSPTVALTTRPVTFTVSYTSVDKTLPMTYTWDFGDGSAGVVTNGPTVSHLFTPTASYPVVVRVENPYDAYTYTYPSLFVAQPVVDASFSYTPTLPETGDVITFTAAHGPDDAQTPTYTWRFEDGAEFTEASGQVVTNTWPVGASGGHTVWLTVTNGYGDPVVYQYVVGVGCSPIKGTAFTYEPASPWVGDTVTFTAAYSPATGVQTPVSFTWDFAGDVQPASQDSTITYTFSPGDEYGVQLTADNNCAVVLYEETVRVHQDVATATYEHTPVQPIVGEPVAFTADYAPVTAYQPVTYTWDWGDGSAQVVTTTDRVTHTFALGDVTRTVWVTVTNPDTEGGGIVYSRTLFVAQPLSGVSLTYMPQFPLEYNPVVFSVTSQPANVSTPITYVWDFGDTSAAVITTAQTVTHAFGFGLYTVAVTATSAYQGEASAQMQVAIGGRPLESTSFDIAYAPPVGSVAFKNEAVTFTAQYEPLDALKPVTYTWNFGDHTPWLVTTTQRVAHTYAATGEYTVWLTTSNPLKDVFAEGAVQVEEPISGVTFTYASPITYGLPVEFVAEAFPADASEPITYTWDFGDGHTSMTTDPTVMHRFWTTGSHTIEVTATNAYAEASCSRMVYVQGQPVEGIMIHWETQSVFTYEPLPISVEIQPSNVTPPITYIWNFTGEPTVPTTTETASYTYTVPGVYTIWLTATNLYGEAVYSFTVEVLSHQPTWEKQVWINGQPLEGKLSEVKFTQSDVISVVDRVNLAYTYPTSFTLEEAWSDAFTLTRVVTNGGELRWDEQLLSWYVTEGSELDEHVITKTFEFTHDAWSVQMITETLTAEDAKPAQLAPKILKFWHKDVCVPIDITEVTTTLMGCIVDFEPLYDGDSPITWAWQFQGGLPATSSVTAPRRIDFRMAGTYPYTVTATNCGGERDTYSDEVTVGCPEVCTDVTEITLAMTNAMPIYTGTAVYFTVDMEPADFTPPYTYTIDYGEGGGTSVPVSGIDNPLTGLTHAYATPGTYDVEIAMWNCKMTEADAVTATVKVVVSKEPDTCVEVTSVDLSLVTTDVIYTDTVVEFSADIFPDNARHPYTYTIDYGAGASDPATSSADPLTTPLNHTFTTPGTYDLEIAVWNCGMTSPVTDVVQVVVSEKGVTCVEVTGVDLSLVTTDVIYTDTVVEFSADIFPDNARHPYTYTIDYGAGASDPATSSADPLTTPLNHTFTTPGTYDVEIAVWNCEMTSPVTDSVEVSVLSQGLIYAVALTPEAASAWDIIGSGVSYRLDVQNLGNGEDTFTLTVEGIWSADVMPDTVTLGAQETETISVTVTIPTEARDGEQDETTVTVTSDGGGASVSDSSTLTTTAVWPRLYLPLVSRDF